MNPNVIRQVIEEAVALAKALGIKLDTVEERKVVLSIPFDSVNMTPMGTMAAGSLFTLAETAGGALLMASLDMTKYSIVAKELSIRFKKPGMSRVTTSLTLSDEEVKKIMGDVEAAGGRTDASLEIPLEVEGGVVVAEVNATFRVRKI